MAEIIIDPNKSFIGPIVNNVITSTFTIFNQENLAYDLYYGFKFLGYIDKLNKSSFWNKADIDKLIAEKIKNEPLFNKWIGQGKAYNITDLTKNLNNNISFFEGIEFNKVLPDISSEYVGLSRKQLMPLLYIITNNLNIKAAINTLVYNGLLNEYYWIEDNGEFRGYKYDRGFPTDNPSFTFKDPIIWDTNGVALRNMKIPGTLPAPKKSANLTYEPYSATQPVSTTPAPITTTPAPITTPPAPTTPVPTTNKNILIIGGLLAAFLIFKR